MIKRCYFASGTINKITKKGPVQMGFYIVWHHRSFFPNTEKEFKKLQNKLVRDYDVMIGDFSITAFNRVK